MTEPSPRNRSALWFLAGILAASAVWYTVAIPAMRNASNEQNIARLREQGLARQEASNAQLQNQLNACNAKFTKTTILYDVGLLNSETRAWLIPADIDPVLIGAKRGTYSHYDPKTQVEMVHLQPKAQ